MRKKVFGRKLSRSRPAREALFATLARALILSGKIITTKAKAKAVQTDLEKFVTLAKRGDLVSRRRALAGLDNAREAADKLFGDIAAAFAGRTSGFTRLISLPRRKGDNSQMVRIEWTEKIENREKRIENSSKTDKKDKIKTPKKIGKKLNPKP